MGLLSFWGSTPCAPFAASPLNWLVGVGQAAAERGTVSEVGIMDREFCSMVAL